MELYCLQGQFYCCCLNCELTKIKSLIGEKMADKLTRCSDDGLLNSI